MHCKSYWFQEQNKIWEKKKNLNLKREEVKDKCSSRKSPKKNHPRCMMSRWASVGKASPLIQGCKAREWQLELEPRFACSQSQKNFSRLRALSALSQPRCCLQPSTGTLPPLPSKQGDFQEDYEIHWGGKVQNSQNTGGVFFSDSNEVFKG